MTSPTPLLVVLAGSRAHGTDGPDADVDLLGVVAPSRDTVLSPFHDEDPPVDPASWGAWLTDAEREAAARTKLEGTAHELRHLLRLLVAGNPHALEVLWGRDVDVRHATEAGRRLRAARAAFVTQRCREAYLGYARAQLARLVGAGADGFDPRHAAHLVRLLRTGHEALTNGVVRVWRGDVDADELRAIRAGTWSLADLEAYATEAMDALATVASPLPTEADRDAVRRLGIEVLTLAWATA